MCFPIALQLERTEGLEGGGRGDATLFVAYMG